MLGVCINYFHENYGGMLQAYATVNLFEKLGVEYELIRYEKNRTLAEKIRSVPRLLNRTLLNDKYEALMKKRGMRAHPEIAALDAKRKKAFQRFKETRFSKFSPVFSGYEQLCKGAERYSAVLTGSDQLWSPAGLPTNFYNLMFVPDRIRKISYASSFGTGSIPWYQRSRTAAYLNRIEYISMRENAGKTIVKELTGRDVPVVLDPVLMFDKAEWETLIEPKREIDEKYLFAYFLGKNPDYRRVVTEIAAERGLKVVVLKHLDQYVPEDESFGDIALYDVDPARFLNLLRGAEYVFTDSFHGACFSVIHEKAFVIFKRYSDAAKHSKNSRIASLCGNLGLEDRIYTDPANLRQQTDRRIDYVAAKKKLAAMYALSDAYLRNALDGIN